jgi:hypothetical protein
MVILARKSQDICRPTRRIERLSQITAATMRTAVAAMGVAISCFATSSAAKADANTLRELYVDLNKCLATAAVRGAPGSELTIVFSLRRDGGLLGKPRVSFWSSKGGADQQRDFANQVATAFDKCLPISITDALGGAIAGRPLSMRFVVRPRETNI